MAKGFDMSIISKRLMYIGQDEYSISQYLPKDIPVNLHINSGSNINDIAFKQIHLFIVQAKLVAGNSQFYLFDLQQKYPTVPILIIDHKLSEIVMRKSFRAGVKDYLLLPEEGERLKKVIEKYILSLIEKDLIPKGLDKYINKECPAEKAIKYIEENYNRKIKVQDLASACCIHPNSLARKFKENQGCTIREFIKNYRINASMILLRKSKLTVETIAYNVGFETVSLFNRLFKQSTGISPSLYRKMAN